MIHVRFYINDLGEIEHTETSTHPLPSELPLEVDEPIGALPTMTLKQLQDLPTRKRAFDCVMCDIQPEDGKFKRAREIMDSLEIDQQTMTPRFKARGKVKGQIMNHRVIRANRGQQ